MRVTILAADNDDYQPRLRFDMTPAALSHVTGSSLADEPQVESIV